MDLDSQFKKAKKISPSNSFKKAGKNRLFRRINEDKLLATHLAHEAEDIQVSDEYRQLTWQRLVSRIQGAQQSFVYRWLGFWKRGLALATVSCLVFVSFFSGAFLNNTIQASDQTYLVVLKGDVYIKHLGQDWKQASDYELLSSSDTIWAKDNTEAEIHFFNSTLTRLAPNTKVVIKSLIAHPRIRGTGFINLYLDQGKLWANTRHVSDRLSKTIIQTKEGVVTSQKATFAISAHAEGGSEVVAYDRSVDLNMNLNADAKTKVTKGHRVRLQPDYLIEEEVLAPDPSEKRWVDENLQRDEERTAELVQETMEIAYTETNGSLFSLPTLGIGSSELEIEDQSASVEAEELMESINSELNHAAAQLLDRKVGDAQNTLSKVQNIVENIDAQGEVDPELREKVELLLKEKEQQFIAIDHLNVELFPLKEAILEAKATVAPESEKAKVKLEIATDKLYEVQELLANNKEEVAVEEIKKVSEVLAELPVDESVETDEEGRREQVALAEEAKPVLEEIIEDIKQDDEKDVTDVGDIELTESKEAIDNFIAQERSKDAKPMAFTIEVNLKPAAPTEAEILAAKEAEAQAQQLQVEEFVDKVEIFESLHSKKTKTQIMLSKIENTPESLPFLYQLRNQTDIRVRHLVNLKIGLIEGSIASAPTQ